ncbi:hypothetical protein, partial [Pararhizobium mangrovi]|uniref:hypothetical protein n=1 Tax=Pararhizobium mangrovi TaxID=2590452 RepID=UPI001AEEE98B
MHALIRHRPQGTFRRRRDRVRRFFEKLHDGSLTGSVCPSYTAFIDGGGAGVHMGSGGWLLFPTFGAS